VSQYFKNALRIRNRIEFEISQDPKNSKFCRFTQEDDNDIKPKSNDEAFSKAENSVYIDKYKYQVWPCLFSLF
jgi:hypothetical protein